LIHPNKIPLWVRAAAAFVVMAALAWMRLRLPWDAVLPIGYTIPLVLIAWFRSRWILWAAVAGLVATMIAKQMLPNEQVSEHVAGVYTRGSWRGTSLIILNLLVLAGLCHLWIASLDRIEAQNAQLANANAELAERDAKILRNIEALRTQTMELERQGIETEKLLIEVARERTRFETVLRTMPFAVAVADATCDDVRLNPAGGVLFNASADANVKQDLANWMMFQNGRPMAAEQFPVLRACREGVEIVAGELELLTAMNKRVTLLANARPIRDRDGKLMGAVGAFVDITPQKELQRELDLRRREAEEASVRKTHFLAAVSHDIRTPANAISLLAELIRRTAANPALSADIPDLAAELHSSAISLINLLSDVLDVARFDSGKIELQETEFQLAGLLEQEHRQLMPLAREKNLDLQWSAPAEPIQLRIDRIKLARILGNLIGNAIKFTEVGHIRVNAHPPDETGLRITVSDTGIGIPPEFQEHIFDEFFQMRNPERDRNKGTGLGLTICKRLIDAMGGSLQVTSAPGKGSTFTITLPPVCVVRYKDSNVARR
jgi:two-component system CheB/CheR fusion protein